MNQAITTFSCKNFRSYRTLLLEFRSQFVVFVGDNGAGKTNILEALSLFGPGRGLRNAALSDFSNRASNNDSWKIDITVRQHSCETFLSTFMQNGRRCAKIDDAPISSHKKYDEILWILWAVPTMDSVFTGNAADRRNFFDHLTSGYKYGYKAHLRKLADLQKERLHILLNRPQELVWLETLERQIAEENVYITKIRQEFLLKIKEVFSQFQSHFLRPQLQLHGTIEQITEHYSEEESVLEIAEQLARNRNDDTIRQSTSIGAHKTFWGAYKENIDAENCSTGEQKAFLVSLILGALRIYIQYRKGLPILLLDDLMVHLDQQRRSYLLQELSTIPAQIFLTGTDHFLFRDIYETAQFFTVRKSMCQEIVLSNINH